MSAILKCVLLSIARRLVVGHGQPIHGACSSGEAADERGGAAAEKAANKAGEGAGEAANKAGEGAGEAADERGGAAAGAGGGVDTDRGRQQDYRRATSA